MSIIDLEVITIGTANFIGIITVIFKIGSYFGKITNILNEHETRINKIENILIKHIEHTQ
ncbi:MAG: hypothetical protein QXJ93_01005 [Candidatus Rehaiarchaeum fermentans]|nr:hypothetical protein [Candidatus Rehaiarchaeum fermentans]